MTVKYEKLSKNTFVDLFALYPYPLVLKSLAPSYLSRWVFFPTDSICAREKDFPSHC